MLAASTPGFLVALSEYAQSGGAGGARWRPLVRTQAWPAMVGVGGAWRWISELVV